MKKILPIVLLLMITLNSVGQINQRSIEVVGKATIKAIPEEVIFRIPLKIIDSSYMECSNAVSKTLNHLRKDLVSKGISESRIHTSNFTISENMVYDGGKRIHQGYKGSVNVIVSENYSTEFVQKVLTSVEKLRLTYSINFSMSPEQKEELTKLAITKAVEDAKQKALVLAEASDLQLGEISLVSYGKDTYRIEPFATERMAISKADTNGSNELNLSPPLTSLFKSVLMIWAIEK